MAFQFPSRLYAILDVDVAAAHGLRPDDVAAAWLRAGVRLLQVRAKTLASGDFLTLATDLAARARRAGATFIVNDRADLAHLAGADGVHLGPDDVALSDVRRWIGDEAVVGLSTHGAEQLEAALEQPADYVAVGAVFPTRIKPADHPVVGLEGLRAAAARAKERQRPLVAIGGIRVDTARRVLEAGASAVAVISDLFVGEPGARVRDFLLALGE